MENLNLTQYIDKFLEELLMIDKSEIYNIGENGIDMKINNKLNDFERIKTFLETKTVWHPRGF